MAGWGYRLVFNHRRERAKLVHWPPYALAKWSQRWHGLCVLCHEPMTDNGNFTSMLCATCHSLMSWHLPPIKLQINQTDPQKLQQSYQFHLYFATFYQYPMNRAMTRFKDSEHLPSLMLLIHAIEQLPKPIGAHADNTVIIPIPTTKKRLVKRGFDPVMVLAKSLSYHWQLPLWQGLDRIDDVHRQRGLSRQQRLNNVIDAFILNGTPPARRVILFDDVATTGATLQAAASVIIRRVPKISLLAVCVAHGVQNFS